MNEKVLDFVEKLVSSSELNQLPDEYGGRQFFAAPVIGVACGADPVFEKFKEAVAPEHLSPIEMWVASGLADEDSLAERLRIVSIIFPYVDDIRREGAANKTRVAPEIYCVARNFASPFIYDVLEKLAGSFQAQGFRAVPGVRSSAFEITRRQEPFRIYSNWSERHIAFAAGLGTFSLSDALITSAGCNVRIGSVITEAPLEVTPRKNDDPFANCLYLARGKCGKCMDKCPGGAITADGHDKLKCQQYAAVIKKKMCGRAMDSLLKPDRRNIGGQIRTVYNVGCGLCQFGVPCTEKNPMEAAL